MEIQKFKLEDDEIKKIEIKDLYNSVFELNKQYYYYYRNMSKIDREYKGNFVCKKISLLFDNVSILYFEKENKNTLKNMYILLKEIEFQIRVMHKLNILPKKSKMVLQKLLSSISIEIKTLKKENELCK